MVIQKVKLVGNYIKGNLSISEAAEYLKLKNIIELINLKDEECVRSIMYALRDNWKALQHMWVGVPEIEECKEACCQALDNHGKHEVTNYFQVYAFISTNNECFHTIFKDMFMDIEGNGLTRVYSTY